MDLGWVGYAWSVVNTICAIVSTICLLWIVRHLQTREDWSEWRTTNAWKEMQRTKRLVARGYDPDGVPLAGERAELSKQDGLAREAEDRDAHDR